MSNSPELKLCPFCGGIQAPEQQPVMPYQLEILAALNDGNHVSLLDNIKRAIEQTSEVRRIHQSGRLLHSIWNLERKVEKYKKLLAENGIDDTTESGEPPF